MSDETEGTRTAFRTCPLCEAGCGLEITVRGGEVQRIRGDRDDVFSHGFICPKGSTLKQLRDDPDRLRTPRIKRDGVFVEASWDEAFAEIEARLTPLIDRHGRDSVAAYIGNPSAHNLGALLYSKAMLKSLGSTNLYSASTVDQRPKEISSALMFGGGLTVPVPDVDRTDYLLMLGANPFASNGSLATAPDWPGRLERLVERGGTLVVVDPRRSRTVEAATEHVAIRPGTDAFFLMALVHTLFADGLVDVSTLADRDLLDGLDDVRTASEPFSPESVAAVTGIEAGTIRRLAHELAAAPAAVVYGRIGTTTQAYGTTASWLIDVLNTLTGNLDQPGGAMFARAAVGASNTRGTPQFGRETKLGRRASRVRGLPETFGELPVVALAEEIETPGDGQIKALITLSGNPVLSIPNGGSRLDAALEQLDFMVSIDIYINETTRHADVILPAPEALAKSHYDIALLQLALHNVANYSPPVFERAADQPDEWEILARMAMLLQGQGAGGDPAVVDELSIGQLVNAAIADESSPIHGRDAADILAALEPRTGPERLVDFLVRTGPYGDGFGREPRDWVHAAPLPDGIPPLTLDVLLDNPHGIDLGPLTPRLPEVLRTPTGKVNLAPDILVADVDRMRAQLEAPVDDGFLLVGRRQLRSNNSWMHNLNVLVKGKVRCTLHLHPDDAGRLGLDDGAAATVTSRRGKVTLPVEVTDGIRPGVVSIPHGWGHDMPGVDLAVASANAGVNSNLLADDELFDPVSGNAVLNGIPVSVSPA